MKIRTFNLSATNPTTLYVREKNTGKDPIPVVFLPAVDKVFTSVGRSSGHPGGFHFEDFPAGVRTAVLKFFRQVQQMPEHARAAFIHNTEAWDVRVRGE